MKQEIIKPGFTYHIYNRGNNKENIFKEEKNYHYFLRLLQKHLLCICNIYSYSLLKNHFHILLRIKESENIPEKYRTKVSQPFSNMFNAYTKGINKVYDRSGSLFQEHFQRHRVNNQRYLVNLMLYIHLNPVKHGFCEEFSKYRFTSYNAYLSDEFSFVDKTAIFEIMGGKENFIYLHDQKNIVYDELLEEIEALDDQP